MGTFQKTLIVVVVLFRGLCYQYRPMGIGGAKYSAALLFVFCLAFPPALHSASPELNPDKYVPPQPSSEFKGTKSLKVEHGLMEGLPKFQERFEPNKRGMSLSDLIDAALEVNPKTRQAWEEAKSKSAFWGQTRSAYYPQISNNTNAITGKTNPQYGEKAYLYNSLGLQYLLFDFGKRSSTAKAAMDALIQSNLIYDQTILDVMRDVPKSYYLLVGTKALVGADEKSLEEARVSLKAAEVRREAGAGTLADVLQARANESQALYQLENDRGQVEVARGALATAVGWPANTAYDITGSLMDVPQGKMQETIDQLIDTAMENRPDLSAAVAGVRQKEQELKRAKAGHAPVLNGVVNYDYFKQRGISEYNGVYGGVTLQIPIFTGFNITNKVREAKANLKSAEEKLVITKEKVITDTWNAYYEFVTSLKTVEAAKALQTSAEESYKVSFGRYKEGAADIVELMTVQSQLFKARSIYINAKTGLHTNYADLIHAIGTGFENPLEVQDKNP